MKTHLLRPEIGMNSLIYLCDGLIPGPMDNTVCDFWRMVWEQHLELILMLTNLEEYSKTKCAKYWPDEAEGDKMFGDFGVGHVREKRYSGLLVASIHVLVLHIAPLKKDDEKFLCYRLHNT